MSTNRRRVRGISGVVIAIIMAVVGVAATLIFWLATQGKFLAPYSSVDLQLDYVGTSLVGKVGVVAVKVASGSGGVTNPQIQILDSETGQQAATCQLTSQPGGSSSGGGAGIYASGDTISWKCTASVMFVRGRTYQIIVTVKDANTGAQFQKSFSVKAQ